MTVIWSGLTEEGAIVPVQVTEEGKVLVTANRPVDPIDGGGASAWGRVSPDGELLAGLNIKSSILFGAANFIVEFQTPMPDASYCVVFGCTDDVGGRVATLYTSETQAPYTKTANGFAYYTQDLATPSNVRTAVDFAVFATNALPPKGGTGTDAWANTGSDGTIFGSFNIASCLRVDDGIYDYTFNTPMPVPGFSVQATANNALGEPEPNVSANAAVYNINTGGFQVRMSYVNFAEGITSGIDVSHSVVVNATDATLPTSFTRAQIQKILELAKRMDQLEVTPDNDNP